MEMSQESRSRSRSRLRSRSNSRKNSHQFRKYANPGYSDTNHNDSQFTFKNMDCYSSSNLTSKRGKLWLTPCKPGQKPIHNTHNRPRSPRTKINISLVDRQNPENILRFSKYSERENQSSSRLFNTDRLIKLDNMSSSGRNIKRCSNCCSKLNSGMSSPLLKNYNNSSIPASVLETTPRSPGNDETEYIQILHHREGFMSSKDEENLKKY